LKGVEDDDGDAEAAAGVVDVTAGTSVVRFDSVPNHWV
jgi:hypothetical protein